MYMIFFFLHENEHTGETNFHMNGFASKLVFTQIQKQRQFRNDLLAIVVQVS